MKHSKNYFLISLVVLSAYLIQRSLLFLTGALRFQDIQEQDQARGSILGLDISFSYLGMNLFWPYLVAFCILGYLGSQLPKDESLFSRIYNSVILKVFLIFFLPCLALFLHYLSISNVFWSSIDIATRFYEGMQGLPVPYFSERMAHISIILLILISFCLSLYAVFKVVLNGLVKK